MKTSNKKRKKILFYDDQEILIMFKGARDPYAQLDILAELNGCIKNNQPDTEPIIEALLRAGLSSNNIPKKTEPKLAEAEPQIAS